MEREFEELTIEPRGNDYVIIRVDGDGIKTELSLSETNVIFLGRLAPIVARRIVASKMPAGSDVSASVAAPAKNFELNSDLHNDLVLLKIRDEFDAEFDFSFGPAGGRYLGERLIKWSDKVANAVKPTKQ
jgi:hypothetical protein